MFLPKNRQAMNKKEWHKIKGIKAAKGDQRVLREQCQRRGVSEGRLQVG